MVQFIFVRLFKLKPVFGHTIELYGWSRISRFSRAISVRVKSELTLPYPRLLPEEWRDNSVLTKVPICINFRQ